MSRFLLTVVLFMPCLFLSSPHSVVAQEAKLRIICFGAHPDDAEYKSGGTAAMWAKLGHQVKLVSVTNGDIGVKKVINTLTTTIILKGLTKLLILFTI